jgi:hypothetical protein
LVGAGWNQTKIVPGAGHTSNMENAATFSERVAEFLVDLERQQDAG